MLRWKVMISDGENSITKYSHKVEWPLQTDGFVRVHFHPYQFTLDEFELLDAWESGQTQLTVSIEAECLPVPAPFNDIQFECNDDIADYNSIDGTATILDATECATINGNTVCKGWEYDPAGEITIPLTFSEWE